MHLYSALLCIVLHPKSFTIMWGGHKIQSYKCCVRADLLTLMNRLFSVNQKHTEIQIVGFSNE